MTTKSSYPIGRLGQRSTRHSRQVMREITAKVERDPAVRRELEKAIANQELATPSAD